MKNLSCVQRVFLDILECFIHEKEYELPKDFDEIVELYQLSVIHKLTPVVYEQISNDKIWNQAKWRELQKIWKKQAIKDVIFQINKTEEFFRIYDQLKELGVQPLVMKGLICRALYPKSEYRISSDEDILIKREKFEICDEYLLENGFLRNEIDLQNLPHEISYINKNNGVYIELHIAMFDTQNEAYNYLNDEFKSAFDSPIIKKIQDREIWTLDPTLHFLFLICHSYKHFLFGGFGIRQICDMVMMAEKDGELIDWKHIAVRLKALRMDMFWSGIVKIGKQHLGFDEMKAMYPMSKRDQKIDYIPLLLDVLNAGIYGSSTKERKHSSSITLMAKEKEHRKNKGVMLKVLFPNYEFMKKSVPTVKKNRFSLFKSYVLRIIRFLKTAMPKKNRRKTSVKIGIERVELMKKYKIID